MSWFVVVPVVWTVVALLVGLLVGRGIRMADDQSACPLPTESAALTGTPRASWDTARDTAAPAALAAASHVTQHHGWVRESRLSAAG